MAEAPVSGVNNAQFVTIECKGNCGRTDRVPAKLVRTKTSTDNNPQYTAVPVASYPYICLTCWKAGCRWSAEKQETYYVPNTNIDPRDVA